MASLPVSQLAEHEKQELLCTYACLILFEEKMSITSDNILKLIKKSNNTVLPYLPALFEKSLKGKDIEGLLSNLNVGGAPSPAEAITEKPIEEKKEAKKEEKVEEEEEDDLGFSLFD